MTKQSELLVRPEPWPDPPVQALTVVDPMIDMIERLASNPAVDVAKLEKIVDLQRSVARDQAKAAFDAAFAKMQANLPAVDEKGRLEVNGTVRSRYAKLEDIQAAIRPVLASHGFSVRYRTEWPSDRAGIIRIVGILSHEQGHSEESAFEAPLDKSQARTDVQSQGSTISYGRRYTLLDLLNIETRGLDNDGATAGRPQPPDGYEDWFKALDAVAADGQKEFDGAWGKSAVNFRNFAVQHDKDRYKAVKEKARLARG
jgi:hypothetical protein